MSHAVTSPDPVPLTFDQALELTETIRNSVSDLEGMIVAAYIGRAWVALDYPSWDSYVQGEFSAAPLALPREDRPGQVLSLRQQGLSLRAIGAVTSLSHEQVRRDAAVTNVTPDSITGIDGKTYEPVKPVEVLTPEEQERRLREQEHRLAVARAVARLEELVNGWVQLKTLPGHPDREAILAGLTEADRLTVLDIERMYVEVNRE